MLFATLVCAFGLPQAPEPVLPLNHRVSSINLGDTRALCSTRFAGSDEWHFDLDHFAVVRDAAAAKIVPQRSGREVVRHSPFLIIATGMGL